MREGMWAGVVADGSAGFCDRRLAAPHCIDTLVQMSFTQWTLLTFLVVIAALNLTLIAWTLTPRARRTAANRLEKSIGIVIPDELRPGIGRQATRRSRISLAGILVGACAAVPFAWSMSSAVPMGTSAPAFLVVGAAFAGAALGAALGSLPRAVPLDKDAIRYARPGAVTLDDYIAPLERRGAWIVVGLATITYLTSVIVTTLGVAPVALVPPATISGVMVGLALASLIFFEVVGTRIVNRAQPIGSEPELVWADALRSANIRGLATAPLTLGVYGSLTSMLDLSIILRNVGNSLAALATVNVVGSLAIMAVIVIGTFSIASRPQRHFLKRLWPHLFDLTVPATVQPESNAEGSAS